MRAPVGLTRPAEPSRHAARGYDRRRAARRAAAGANAPPARAAGGGGGRKLKGEEENDGRPAKVAPASHWKQQPFSAGMAPMAQDLLAEYAKRRRSVDPEFANDLEEALRLKGYPVSEHGIGWTDP